MNTNRVSDDGGWPHLAGLNDLGTPPLGAHGDVLYRGDGRQAHPAPIMCWTIARHLITF